MKKYLPHFIGCLTLALIASALCSLFNLPPIERYTFWQTTLYYFIMFAIIESIRILIGRRKH